MRHRIKKHPRLAIFVFAALFACCAGAALAYTSILDGVSQAGSAGIAHDSITAGTIGYHSDTTATGAELETMTNGGDATLLHTHARAVTLNLFDSATTVTIGTGANGLPIPAFMNGMELTDVVATVYTKGVTATTDVMVVRRRAGSNADMLSVAVTIGDEWFANDETVNTANDDLATGDEFYIDVDAVHSGTAPFGLSVACTFQ